MVTMSYILFKEKLNIPQMLGIAVIILGIIVVCVFKTDSKEHEQAYEIDQAKETLYKVLTIAAGLGASILFGS